MTAKSLTAIFAFALISAWGLTGSENEERISIKKPFGQHHNQAATPTTQILYHGGNLLNQASVPLYAIYYGPVGDFPVTTQPIIDTFLSGLSGQPAFDVNTTYCKSNTTDCTGSGTSITGTLSYGIAYDSGSQGMSISSSSIPKIIQTAIATGALSASSTAIYLVMTAPTVHVSGFCTSFCAYHTKSTKIISGYTIHYALVPEPGAKCTSCDGNFATYLESTTPNGDAGADEMVDSIFHEVSETVSDPDLDAWYTSGGAENADLCNYVYQTATVNTTFKSPTTGATANAEWGHFYYLVQLIWKNGPMPQSCAAAP